MKRMTKNVLAKFRGIIRCRNPECEQIIQEGDSYEVVRSAGQFRYYCVDCSNEEVLVFQPNRLHKKRVYRHFRRFNEVHRKMPAWFFTSHISEWVQEQIRKRNA